MTVLERRRSPNGGAPARRAMARWAWRLFRREWRQQLLVLALITAAVAATVLGAGIATNAPPPADATFGGASYAITLPGTDPHLAADVASITARIGPGSPAQVIEQQNLTTGSVNPVELRAENPAGPFGPATLALVAGRYPAGAGQVALTPQVASLYGTGIGQSWHAAGRVWHVVGLVQNPADLLDEFAVAAPGQLPAPGSVTILLDATPTFRLPSQATLQTPAPAPGGFSPALVVLVLAIFGLLFVGLIAAAAFTVLAQRRLRGLGMISALGATDRHVRLVMIANGAVVGALATLAGAATGVLLWLAYAPHLQASAGHRIDELNLPWPTIAAVMALALLTAMRAARRPARAITRMSTVAALAGRTPRPKAAHRTAIPGLLLLGVGAYLLAYAGGWGATGLNDTLHLIGGLVAIVLGSVFIGPLCISALAAAGRHAPLPVRIAVRDLARYRSRSAGARAIAADLGTSSMLTLQTATGLLLQTTDGGTDVGQPYVATQGLLAFYGIKPGAIQPGAVLLTSHAGLAAAPALQLPAGCSFSNQCPPASCILHPPIQSLAGLPADSADPNLVLTTYAVHKYRLRPYPAAWLIQTRHPLTSAEINGARQRAEALGLTIQTKNDNPSLSQLDTWAIAAGLLLALGVLAATVGLVRGESAPDLRILTAAGAGSQTRRAITAATAASLGLLGALVGTSVAYLASLAYFRGQLSERLTNVPAADLIVILVGLPVIAAIGGWLLSGRQPRGLSRRPLD
jgi:putative ABC transport system permease protein